MAFNKILDLLPSYFDKTSYPVPIFQVANSLLNGNIQVEMNINGTGETGANVQYLNGELVIPYLTSDITFSISVDTENAVMTIARTSGLLTINIQNLTIKQILQTLQNLGIYLTPLNEEYNNLYWFTLVSTTDPDTVYYESSLLRRFISAVVAQIQVSKSDWLQALNDIYMDQAVSFWLDLWGSYFGFYRVSGESDSAFLNRIIKTVLMPKLNNKALESILSQSLPQGFKIVDLGVASANNPTNVVAPNKFGVLGFITGISALSSYQQNILKTVINTYKASGTEPIYFVPAGILHTNTAGEIDNSTQWNISPKASSWGEIAF